jgi:hypothetical protein
MKKIGAILILLCVVLQSCSFPVNLIGNPPTEISIPSPISTQVPTNSPTLTPSPTPKSYNPTPDLMVAPEDIKNFKLTSGNDQSPAPIGFRERFAYPVGGIEGWPGCEDSTILPFFLNSPTIFEALSVDPWNEDRIDTCGWAEGETVKITVIKPDGSQEYSTQTYESGMSVSYRPQMDYGMQLGDYSVIFESPSGTLELNFSIVRPSSPGMAKVDNHTYYVFGLAPGEPVSILVYSISTEDRTVNMVTWGNSTVDDRGELLLDYAVEDDLLVVVGDASYYDVWSNVFWGIFIGDKIFYEQADPCEGSPMSRLQTWDLAYVLDGSPNNVRSSPSISADLVGTVMPGTVLYVGKNTPVCADGYLWWYVFPKGTKGPEGWTAEGKGSAYWLAPLK